MSDSKKSYFGLFVSTYNGDNNLDGKLTHRVDFFTPNGERRMCAFEVMGRSAIIANKVNIARLDIYIDVNYAEGDVINLFYGVENVGRFEVFYLNENNESC